MKPLTILEAAARIERSPRQVERYIAAGLPVTWVDRKRYVDEQQLLAAFRKNLLANPTRGQSRDA